MKKKIRYLAMLLMSTALVLGGCGGGANSAASQQAAEEASRLAEEEAKAAEEAAAEAARKAEEEAARKAEEEAAAAEAALEAELAEYGIERVDEGVLVDIAALCAEEKYTEACDIMRTDPAYEEAAKALEASGEDRLIVQTEHGRIGMYHANGSATIFVGDYFIYYGDYAGDQREGNGVWMEADSFEGYENYYQIMSGTWVNDLPNGTFESRTLSGDGGESVTEYPYKDGVTDGERTYTWTDESGEEHENTETFRNGYLAFFEIKGKSYTIEDLNELNYEYMNLGGDVGWYYEFVEEDGSVFYTKEDVVFAGMDENFRQYVSQRNYLLGFRPFE
ncbi:MAG: hypothetical protein IJQ12_01080 [Lachnospiraceae bacterium]|nr:hypothetical protein [Lachnospiraceae bacterium]